MLNTTRVTEVTIIEQSGRIQDVVAWLIIGAVALTDAVWISVSDFRFSIMGSSGCLLGALTSGSLFSFYRLYRRDKRIEETLSAVLLLITFTAVAAPLSYLTASLNQPLWDNTFFQWDQSLGLQWRAYLAWVNERPLLDVWLKISYESLMLQMIVCCLILGLTGRFYHLRCFVLTVIVSGVLCVLVSAVMPALAMYVYLGLEPADFPNLSPSAGYVHVAHVHGLREGTFRVLALNASEGIITFPSYHATLGAVFTAALWPVPLVRWPTVGLNLMLIAATPIHGGHYFVDLGAGMIIAVVSWLAAANVSSVVRRAKPASAITLPA